MSYQNSSLYLYKMLVYLYELTYLELYSTQINHFRIRKITYK